MKEKMKFKVAVGQNEKIWSQQIVIGQCFWMVSTKKKKTIWVRKKKGFMRALRTVDYIYSFTNIPISLFRPLAMMLGTSLAMRIPSWPLLNCNPIVCTTTLFIFLHELLVHMFSLY